MTKKVIALNVTFAVSIIQIPHCSYWLIFSCVQSLYAFVHGIILQRKKALCKQLQKMDCLNVDLMTKWIKEDEQEGTVWCIRKCYDLIVIQSINQETLLITISKI